MAVQQIKIKKGLDLPIGGRPAQTIEGQKHVSRVALLGRDYIGVKPHFAVSVGDSVKLGQVLFIDKNKPSLCFTAPGSGKVSAIHRGRRRALTSVVIDLDSNDAITFQACPEHKLAALKREQVISLLLSSGLWTSLRSRPFSTIADPDISPASLFITAMDTNPLAPDIARIMEGKEEHFIHGLTVLSTLTDGPVFLCKGPGSAIPEADLEKVRTVEFSGPHPAGNPGTHIHCLAPVSRHRQAWHISAQDVIAAGMLFTTGTLNMERTISLAGPSVNHPRLITARVGASLVDIVSDELAEGEQRVISGSVLSGHIGHGDAAYLGRFHQQVTVISENKKRELLGWLRPGVHEHSVKNIVLSKLLPDRTLRFDTSTHGELRAIMPVGTYEKIMPLDILPTHLLKALAVDDIDEAELLGALELDEEDLSLCSYVCPSKIDHGAALRRNLTLIAKEG